MSKYRFFPFDILMRHFHKKTWQNKFRHNPVPCEQEQRRGAGGGADGIQKIRGGQHFAVPGGQVKQVNQFV
jgi:hypothetical protein